ncbi:MAG: DUF885 domain-containing protein [Frankiaceae bacterium]
MTDEAPDGRRGGIAALADSLVVALFDADPLFATLVGVHDRDERLPDLSAAAQEATAERLVRLAATAREASAADADERVTRDVVVHAATAEAQRLRAGLVELTVTDLWVAPVAAMLAFFPDITLPEPELATAYLRRLEALPGYVGAAAERHRQGTAAGRTAVHHLVEAAMHQLDRWLDGSERDPFAVNEPPAGWGGAERFVAERARIIAEVVRPAMAGYRDALRADVLPHARPADRAGLCWVPGGDELYATMTRLHTTTDATPHDLHALGLELMDRLDEEYAEIGQRAFGTSDVPVIHGRLRDDPDLRFRDADEMVHAALAAVRRAEDRAPEWFGTVPEQPCVVRPVPSEAADHAPGAYYMPASLDGSRPGVYYLNTLNAAHELRAGAEAVAFHEACPGHHFQSALLVESRSLPLLRRILSMTAYDEGWGLYSERLADEMGLYSDDLSRLGMLVADSMRAARLVVDTGLHALGWSREQAVGFCRERTPMALHDIEVEIDRYIADPAQALAYMVGRLEIQRLRAGAERTLGERFDPRAFHDVVLLNGSVPLGLLGELVAEWTAATAS